MGFLGLATSKELEAVRQSIEELADTGVVVSDLTDKIKVFMGDAVVDASRYDAWMFLIGRRYHFSLAVEDVSGYNGQLFIAPPNIAVGLGGLIRIEGVRSSVLLEENVGSGAEETPAQAYWTQMPVGRPGIGFYVPSLGLEKIDSGKAGVIRGAHIPWNLKYGLRTKGSIDQIP